MSWQSTSEYVKDEVSQRLVTVNRIVNSAVSSGRTSVLYPWAPQYTSIVGAELRAELRKHGVTVSGTTSGSLIKPESWILEFKGPK